MQKFNCLVNLQHISPKIQNISNFHNKVEHLLEHRLIYNGILWFTYFSNISTSSFNSSQKYIKFHLHLSLLKINN